MSCPVYRRIGSANYLQTLLSHDPLDLAQIDETYVNAGQMGRAHLPDVFTTLFLGVRPTRRRIRGRSADTEISDACAPLKMKEVDSHPLAIAAWNAWSFWGVPAAARARWSTTARVWPAGAWAVQARLTRHEHFNLSYASSCDASRLAVGWRRRAGRQATSGTILSTSCAGRLPRVLPAALCTLLEDGGLIFFDGLDEVSASDASVQANGDQVRPSSPSLNRWSSVASSSPAVNTHTSAATIGNCRGLPGGRTRAVQR